MGFDTTFGVKTNNAKPDPFISECKLGDGSIRASHARAMVNGTTATGQRVIGLVHMTCVEKHGLAAGIVGDPSIGGDGRHQQLKKF